MFAWTIVKLRDDKIVTNKVCSIAALSVKTSAPQREKHSRIYTKKKNTQKYPNYVLSGTDERQSEIESIKTRLQQMKVGTMPDNLPMAPTMLSGEPPSICRHHVCPKLDRLTETFRETCLKEFSEQQRRFFVTDLAIMLAGGMNTIEIKLLIRKAIAEHCSDMEAREKKVIERALQHERYQMYDIIENEVSEPYKDALFKTLEVGPSEEFQSLEERIDDFFLSTVAPFRRREYLAEKRRLLFSLKDDPLRLCEGASMLPTLPNNYSVYCATEATEANVIIGDIVEFVMVLPSGQARLVIKRITGLAGDIVEDLRKNRMLVPPKHFWAVGDNQAQSCDSRHCGAVPLSNLRGRVIANISFPPNYSLAFPCIRFIPRNKAANPATTQPSPAESMAPCHFRMYVGIFGSSSLFLPSPIPYASPPGRFTSIPGSH
jgi:Signal peptidase, peptidase S26